MAITATPRRAALPVPSNLVHPSRTGIEAGRLDPLVGPVDGVASTPETETGDGVRAQVVPDRVDPGPAEALGPAVPDQAPVARRSEPSWEAAALNRANPTLGTGVSGCPEAVSTV